MRLRWGIVGLGNIAHSFVQDLQLLWAHEVAAVASRDIYKAEAFAKQYRVSTFYGNYQELFASDDIDIVYIATPHDSHAALSIEAMEAGKHVLCEKPLAINSSQVRDMISAAKRNQVFLMEAFWSRFNPTIREVLRLIKDKAIGDVNYLNADFTFYRNDPKESRMLNMDLAGGSLLDMGVYPVFLSYMVFGVPYSVLATSRFHETGADIQTAAILKYENGIANLLSGFVSQSDMIARIYGDQGAIHINNIWHEAQGYSITLNGKTEHRTLPTLGKGFTYEIEECLLCIRNGHLESSLWSHNDSLSLIKIVDAIREKSGLIYPFEKQVITD